MSDTRKMVWFFVLLLGSLACGFTGKFLGGGWEAVLVPCCFGLMGIWALYTVIIWQLEHEETERLIRAEQASDNGV